MVLVVILIIILLVIKIVLNRKQQTAESEGMQHTYDDIYATVSPVSDPIYNTINANAVVKMSQNEAYIEFIKKAEMKQDETN